MGIYSHVERIHRPFLKREFGNDDGVLYEGTVVDFYPGWLGSFEHKLGSDEVGRKKIQKLIDVLNNPNDNIESLIGELVDLESFYVFWAMEGLLGFWDGYSGNRNNFFIILTQIQINSTLFLGAPIACLKDTVLSEMTEEILFQSRHKA